MSASLDGRVAVITGSASGIEAAMARESHDVAPAWYWSTSSRRHHQTATAATVSCRSRLTFRLLMRPLGLSTPQRPRSGPLTSSEQRRDHGRHEGSRRHTR